MSSPPSRSQDGSTSRASLLAPPAADASSSSSSSSSSPSSSSTTSSSTTPATVNLFGSWNLDSSSPHYPSSFSTHDFSSSGEQYYGAYGQPQHADYSLSDLSSLSDSGPVYRSVMIETDNTRTWYQQQQPQPYSRSQQHAPSLEQFDHYNTQMTKQMKQMSLNPKHENNNNDTLTAAALDYTVLSPTAPLASSIPAATPVAAPVAAAVVSPPFPPHDYLEPNYHFFLSPIKYDPHAILQKVLTVLVARGVDCQLQPEKFTITAEAYRDCARVEFRVRLFSIGDQRGNYAIEVQRRFGDGMVFHALYITVKGRMETWAEEGSSNTTTTTPASPSPKSSVLTCPPLDLPDLRCTRQVQYDVVKCLVAMCETECVDVKSTAIVALAQLSQNPEYKEALLKNGAIDSFLHALPCDYQDVHRCALAGLANLMSCRKNVKACNAFLNCDASVSAIQRLVKSGCPQVLRDCARTVALITQTMKDTIKDDTCLRRCLEALKVSEDQQVKESVQQALDTLAAVS